MKTTGKREVEVTLYECNACGAQVNPNDRSKMKEIEGWSSFGRIYTIETPPEVILELGPKEGHLCRVCSDWLDKQVKQRRELRTHAVLSTVVPS